MMLTQGFGYSINTSIGRTLDFTVSPHLLARPNTIHHIEKNHHIQCCVLPKGRIVCWSPRSQVSQKIQWKSSRLRRVNYRATLGRLDSSGGLNSWSLEGHRGPATKARPIVLHLQSKVGTTYWPPTFHTYCVQDYVILLLSPEHWQVGLAGASADPDCRLVGHNRFGLVQGSPYRYSDAGSKELSAGT